MNKFIILFLASLVALTVSGCDMADTSEVQTEAPIIAPTSTPSPTPTPVITAEPATAVEQYDTTQSYNIGNNKNSYTYKNNYVTTNSLTLSKYERIQNGMSYAQVASVLGSDGNMVYSLDMNSISMRGYGWYGEYGFPMVYVVMQDGEVVDKFQIGLTQ